MLHAGIDMPLTLWDDEEQRRDQIGVRAEG
jgi:hypothetical protein